MYMELSISSLLGFGLHQVYGTYDSYLNEALWKKRKPMSPISKCGKKGEIRHGKYWASSISKIEKKNM